MRFRFLSAALALTVLAMPIGSSAEETVTAASAPLSTFLKGLSIYCGRHIVPAPSIATLNVSLPTTRVTCDSWFAALEQKYHVHPEDENGVLVVVPDEAVSSAHSVHLQFADANAIVAGLRASPLSAQGLVAIADERTNTVVLQGPSAAVSIALDLVQRQDEAQTIAPPGSSESTCCATVKINNTDVNEAAQQVTQAFASGSFGRLTVVPKPENSSLLLVGSPGAVRLAEQLLSTAIDVPVAEVALQVRVYDVQPENDNINLGPVLSGVAPGGSASGSITVTPNQLFAPSLNKWPLVNATINTLIQHGHARVLADPTILVRSGKTVPLHIGQVQPIVSNNGGFIGGNTISQEETGITLTATPIASANGRVHMTLAVNYSEVVGFNQGYPIVNARSVSSTLDVNRDQTITFGGLTSDTQSVTDTKIPLLGDIPLFGRFFHDYQTTHAREMVVFEVTPCVIEEADRSATTPHSDSCASLLPKGAQ